MKKLDFNQMCSITGGKAVSVEEYCKTLGTIMANNDLDEGAKEGAKIGWNKYCA